MKYNHMAGKALIVLLASTSLMTGLVAYAEEPEAEKREETVTVYGTSNPIPVFDYPGQVSVIKRDEIDLLAPSAPSDLLRDVPGVDFAGGPRRTGEAPSIRGLSGENILILVDGARQSFISAHDGRFFLDPEILGSAEVVRGPASALYGSGAVGGVLAFETVDPETLLREGETFGARIRAGYQSVNEESFGMLTLFTDQGQFDALGSFGLRQSGDIELGSGADLPADDEINTGLLKAGYDFNDALRAELSWQRFDNSVVEPNNGQGINTQNVDNPDVDKDVTSEIWTGNLAYNPLSDLINARFTAYSSTSEVSEFDPTIPRTADREIDTTGISLRNSSAFDIAGIELVFTIGGDWYKDEQTGTDTRTETGLRNGVPNGESEFTGIFAQLETEIENPLGAPGSLILIPSLRYDEFDSSTDSIDNAGNNSDDAVSSRFAASYGPVEWFRIFGSWSEAFRAPSLNELYLDGVHFNIPHPILFNPRAGQFVFAPNNFIANPDLKPETSETFEVGFGFDFAEVFSKADRLQSKISWYNSDVEDLINLNVDTTFSPTCFAPPTFLPCNSGTTNSANVDDAELKGVELEVIYDSPRYFSQLSYSRVEGEDKVTGADVGALTPDRWALNFAIKAPEWNARFGTRVQIASDFERFGVGANGALELVEERDSYTVTDIYASWSPDFANGVRFDASVENLFDEDYERVFAGVSEPARNFKIAASWQFGR